MDPEKFGYSTLPLNHAPYGIITPEKLAGQNKGKVAVITGAARGIGREIARHLAISGANIAILDVRIEDLTDTKVICEKLGVKVNTYACDITDTVLVRTVLKEIEYDLGHIGILVNNAGVSPNRPQWQEQFEDFWRTIEINFKGAMLLTWEVLAGMRERKSGTVISIASRAATVDVPFGIGYCSSKAAIARAMSTLQEEIEFDGLGENIHFFALHPGGVPTAMAKGEFSSQMLERYPGLSNLFDFDKLFVDGPELCGATCAYLATGKGKELRGLYLDCRQDVERVSAVGREQLLKDFHNTLTVNFIDGYKNEP